MNLSEVVVRSGDTFDQLKRKVEIATILGTLQATLTDFRYLNPKWRENTEEEALLGVSLTGIMDHKHLSGDFDYPMIEEIDGYEKAYHSLEEVLTALREVAIETNKKWADRLGIRQSAAITCVS